MRKRRQGWPGLLLVLLLWQLISLWLNKPFLPSPVATATTFFRLLKEDLLLHAGLSFLRVLAGLFVSAVTAIPLGLMLGRVEKLDCLLSPVIFFFYPIPKVAFLPLVLLAFGIGNSSSVFLIFLVLFFQIAISARDGIKTLPREYFQVMTSLQSSTWQLYCHLILPGSLPKIFTTLRVSLGTALAVLFFAETQAVGGYGIGYFIFDAMLRVQYKEMFAGICAIGLMGWLLFKLVDLGERYFCPWLPDKEI